MFKTSMSAEPMIGALGAEIEGVDLSRKLDTEQLSDIKLALQQFHLIVFRNQNLSSSSQIEFGKGLGELKQHPFINSLDGYPEIMVVRKDPDDQHNFAGAWHTDTSYQEVPALASMLLAVEVPKNLGDTLFCNMVAAYEALSESMRGFLESLEAVHSFAGGSSAGREQDLGYGALAQNHQHTDAVIHPVIRKCPHSDRKYIYVNPMFSESILGLEQTESKAILEFLFDHCVRSEFVTRLRWQAGTLAIWHNGSTMHNPLNDYAGHRRIMHRVVIAGDEHCGRVLTL